jgi:hypothetical protein
MENNGRKRENKHGLCNNFKSTYAAAPNPIKYSFMQWQEMTTRTTNIILLGLRIVNYFMLYDKALICRNSGRRDLQLNSTARISPNEILFLSSRLRFNDHKRHARNATSQHEYDRTSSQVSKIVFGCLIMQAHEYSNTSFARKPHPSICLQILFLSFPSKRDMLRMEHVALQ